MPPFSTQDDTPPVRRVAVVLNCRSGSRQAGERQAEIETAFGRLGVTAAFVEVADAGAVEALATRRDAPWDVVVAAGGDGTVNTVANALARAARAGAPVPPALGIVALGTFNYVTRRYALGETLEEAVRTVVAGRTIGIAAGEVSGRLFLNNCSLGLYTSIIDARERHKRMFGRSRVVALASALATVLGRHARTAVRIAQDGRERSLRASLLFVGANPLQLDELDPGIARQVGDGALALVVVRAVDLRRLLAFAWRALAGAVAEAPEIEAEAVQALTLALRRRRVRVVVDGELHLLPTPLEVRWRRDALRLRVPREPREPPSAAQGTAA